MVISAVSSEKGQLWRRNCPFFGIFTVWIPSYLLKILFLIDKPWCNRCKNDQICHKYRNSRHCKSLSCRDASDHMTCLGKRQCRDKFSKKTRKLFCREKCIAQICHRHNHVIRKARHIGMVFGIKRYHNSNCGKHRSV